MSVAFDMPASAAKGGFAAVLRRIMRAMMIARMKQALTQMDARQLTAIGVAPGGIDAYAERLIDSN